MSTRGEEGGHGAVEMGAEIDMEVKIEAKIGIKRGEEGKVEAEADIGVVGKVGEAGIVVMRVRAEADGGAEVVGETDATGGISRGER